MVELLTVVFFLIEQKEQATDIKEHNIWVEM